ncbi:MAG: CBS domain-containing protein [Desulfobacterales bacterium]|nr:CBS domain-containing protein [Desulfobacterales bacterium]MCP4161112.1 CBS domain-containing protein [Deltaproteobacteria bacterium]
MNKKFIISIVLPTLLSISMFIIAFYFFFIPMFESSMMDGKKEVIAELTNTAWSVLAEYNDAYRKGELTRKEAKAKAVEHVGKMRYGNEQKDYFWIISTVPEMIMHPYREELVGRNLADFTDNHENKLFVDAAELVKKEGAGTIRYYWQWKDDSSRIVPKLSYVKGFSEWGWIIGTGIYLEDVRLGIRQLKIRLWVVSSIIILIIIFSLFYVLQQSKIIEEKRKEAENQLKLSIKKYKILVQASPEGTLMVVDEKIVFANIRFTNLHNVDNENVIGCYFSELFEIDWKYLVSQLENPKRTYSFETRLLKARAGLENVVVSVSRVMHSGQLGYFVVVKNVTKHKRLEFRAQKLSDEIELSLQLMNQPIYNLINENIYCSHTDTIIDAAVLMSDNQTKIICVKDDSCNIIGVITDSDMRSRVIAMDESLDKPVSSYMTSPTIRIHQNALMYEAVMLFNKHHVSHLLVENSAGQIIGNISSQECLELQRNLMTYMMREINECTVVKDLKTIYNTVPLLVQAVFTSTDNINSISRIMTAIADAINTRIIELAVREVGPPPCDFAFVVTGSVGRGEQTLKTDQDNAIIFDDMEESKDYFLRLGELVNENLHVIGYTRCNGDLMAGNPEWCNSLNTWKKHFSDWINNPDIKNALDSSIFCDIRFVYGKKNIVDQLQEHIKETLEGNTLFFNQLAKTVVKLKPEFENNRVDIKNFLRPIVCYLRIHALKHAIQETNSLLRLDQLIGYGYIQEMTGQEIEEMYKFLMHLRIKRQVNLILDNDLPVNHILLQNLTSIETGTLVKIQQQVSKLLDELLSTFKLTES